MVDPSLTDLRSGLLVEKLGEQGAIGRAVRSVRLVEEIHGVLDAHVAVWQGGRVGLLDQRDLYGIIPGRALVVDRVTWCTV